MSDPIFGTIFERLFCGKTSERGDEVQCDSIQNNYNTQKTSLLSIVQVHTCMCMHAYILFDTALLCVLISKGH